MASSVSSWVGAGAGAATIVVAVVVIVCFCGSELARSEFGATRSSCR